MDLFFVSGNDELVVDYYNKIKSLHQEKFSLNDIFLNESKVLYSQANLVYANFLQSKAKIAESLEYLFLAKELLGSIPQRIPIINLEISNVLVGQTALLRQVRRHDPLRHFQTAFSPPLSPHPPVGSCDCKSRRRRACCRRC